MKLSTKAKSIYNQIASDDTKLGDLRKIAKEIKKDHDLALELWTMGGFFPRQLAVLIMDKNLLSQEVIDELDKDIQTHDYNDRNQLTDWLMANQLTKSKKTIKFIESWEHSSSAIQRRIFWYYQGRLRWMGKTPPPNTDALLSAIEERIEHEQPEVQWAMHFTASFIGVYESEYRSRCIALGERLGWHKDEKVAKGCAPNYLPDFIRFEVNKLKKS